MPNSCHCQKTPSARRTGQRHTFHHDSTVEFLHRLQLFPHQIWTKNGKVERVSSLLSELQRHTALAQEQEGLSAKATGQTAPHS